MTLHRLREHKCDVMIGCASFEGTDPQAHAMALSFLHHHARAPEKWRVRAHDNQFVDMNMMEPDQIETRAAIRSLPPLIRGYLKLGAYFGDGAVIDHQFGTTDVLVILPVEAIDDRYFAHFGAPDALVPGVLQPDRIGKPSYS
jgi:putative hemolysin